MDFDSSINGHYTAYAIDDSFVNYYINYDNGIDYWYDLKTNKTIEFNSQTEQGWFLCNRYKDYMSVLTTNKNGTIFFATMDESGNYISEPCKCDGDNYIYLEYYASNEEDGSINIYHLPEMSLISNIPDAHAISSDEDDLLLWTVSSENKTSCFGVVSGEEMFTIDGIYEVKSNFKEGYAILQNSETGETSYIGKDGKFLEIYDVAE